MRPIKSETKRLLWIPVVIMAGIVVVNTLELASCNNNSLSTAYYSGSAEGTIESLQPDHSSLTLRLNTGESAVVDVVLDSAETVVLLEGQVASLQELVRGQRVKVHYKVHGDKRVATSVSIQMPAARFAPAMNDWKSPGLP